MKNPLYDSANNDGDCLAKTNPSLFPSEITPISERSGVPWRDAGANTYRTVEHFGMNFMPHAGGAATWANVTHTGKVALYQPPIGGAA